MNIRSAHKDEVKVLQDLNDLVFKDNSKYDPDLKLDWAQSPIGKEYFESVLNNADAICLIAEENSKPIGYIAAVPRDFGYRLSKYIEIENMGVSSEFQSEGIGSQLVDKCLDIARKNGFQKVYVNSYSDNIKAVSFYEKCGLKKIDVSLEKNL
jgi:ribosomal protein S18 acetylase RimI-like enzyme